MADAAVEFLLGNLKQLLVYNAHLISTVKDQVDSLCNDLRLLAAFVKETTESRSKHAVVKELVRRIRIEVYKAEDIVDIVTSKKGSCKFDNIAKLSHLEKLKLLNDTYPIPPLEGKLHGLPEWYKFPPKLKKLTISDTMLGWKDMSVLGKLPGLEVLKLGDNAFVGEIWKTPDGSFVRLRVLQIGKTDLVHWEAAGHQFPQLQQISLKHCEQLVELPSGLGDIETLEVMELSWTSRKAIASARLIQKNFKLLVFPPDQDTQT
ncbi:NB-ARC domains-containing protein [Artemisia annua]|uniref:NB-ARC domains-containing protein n=1 Tax=Artemisia annua TaxID=35608 RepID=A0A2U1PS60_ARTAN|nr:NB-ARC domains-containing protein [Artemisia annua]